MTSSDREQLLGWVSVVEVHHVRQKHLSAVVARDSPQISKPCKRCLLAASNPLDLRGAMTPVVTDVVWALRLRARHWPLL